MLHENKLRKPHDLIYSTFNSKGVSTCDSGDTQITWLVALSFLVRGWHACELSLQVMGVGLVSLVGDGTCRGSR